MVGLSESRHRLTAELSRSRLAVAREAEVQSSRYAKALERIMTENSTKQKEFERILKEVQKDANAVRLAVTHKVSQTVDETFKIVRELKNGSQGEAKLARQQCCGAQEANKLADEIRELRSTTEDAVMKIS